MSDERRHEPVGLFWGGLVLLVEDEVARARRIFPGNRNLTLAMAEEAGEVVRAVMNRWHAMDAGGDVGDADLAAADAAHAQAIREEIIQTMAMCVRLLMEGDSVQGLPPLLKGER